MGTAFNDQTQRCEYKNNVVCRPGRPSFTRGTGTPQVPPKPPPLPSPSPPLSPSNNTNTNTFVGYFPSWAMPWASSPQTTLLANLAPHVTTVILSFLRPDPSTYPGGVTFTGTGLDFSSDPIAVRDAIKLLKQRNPGTKVLVAVGGATYTNFASLNATAIANFVNAFGLDGVDFDYEPLNANCKLRNGSGIQCATDEEYITSITALRAALPRPTNTLTAAVWSIGAYGQGQWTHALPQNLPATGVAVNMLSTVGSKALDAVHVMAYDAGDGGSTGYDPKQAFLAYASLVPPQQLYLGMQVAPEGWGAHALTGQEVDDLTRFVKDRHGGGMMLWNLLRPSSSNGTYPGAEEIGRRVCRGWGWGGRCDFSLLNCLT